MTLCTIAHLAFCSGDFWFQTNVSSALGGAAQCEDLVQQCRCCPGLSVKPYSRCRSIKLNMSNEISLTNQRHKHAVPRFVHNIRRRAVR